MERKMTYLVVLLAFLGGALRAQISPLADQYLLNPFLTNPALAGTSSRSPISLGARQQWLGIRGAPSWQTATFHTMLNERKNYFNPRGFVNKGENAFGNIGIGGGIFNVSYGAINEIGLHLDYAYHVFLGSGRLSFGLAPMYHQFIVNKDGFVPPDGNSTDPLIDNSAREVLHFVDVNAGVHYYSDKLYAGFSVAQLFNSSVWFGDLTFNSADDFKENSWLQRSIYLYGGMTPRVGDDVVVEPGALVKYNASEGFRFQVSLKATLKENYHAGILFRYNESAGFFAGVRVGDLVIRYQFELPVGTDMQTRFTTNSILVGYLL
jgi:type IX secretion system PorP/SprF family membrane protein